MGVTYRSSQNRWHLLDPEYRTNQTWHYVKNIYELREDGWHPTYTYKWDVSEWSPCSDPCGPGVQHRTASCFRMDGLPRHDAFCGDVNKPPVTQDCVGGPCTWSIFKFNPDDWVVQVYIHSGPDAGTVLGGRQGSYNSLRHYMVNGYPRPPLGTVMRIAIVVGNRKQHLSIAASNADNTPVTVIDRGGGWMGGYDGSWFRSWGGYYHLIAGWGKKVGKGAIRTVVVDVTVTEPK